MLAARLQNPFAIVDAICFEHKIWITAIQKKNAFQTLFSMYFESEFFSLLT